MHLVGLAASAVWAYDLGLVFLTVAVDGLRAQGQLRELAQALTSQAWAAVHLAREPLAVLPPRKASPWPGRLVNAVVVAAQLAKAAIAAERATCA